MKGKSHDIMSFHSEYEVEALFINRLKSIGYEYIELNQYPDVIENFRKQLAKFNKEKLEEKKGIAEFSDAEFNRILIHIENRTVYEAAKILRDQYILQLDNGETVFVVSLEDDLIRLHADTSVFQKAIKNKHKDGVELVHPLLKRLISRAQDEVETEYSSARKEMLKFDNPANKQRSIVYSLRDEIISAENPDFILDRYIEETVDSFIGDTLPPDDLDVSAEDIDMLCQK